MRAIRISDAVHEQVDVVVVASGGVGGVVDPAACVGAPPSLAWAELQTLPSQMTYFTAQVSALATSQFASR